MTKNHTNTTRRRWKQLHKKFLRKGLSQQAAAEKADALLGTAVTKIALESILPADPPSPHAGDSQRQGEGKGSQSEPRGEGGGAQ